MVLCDLCQRILTLDPSNLKKENGQSAEYGYQTAYTHTFSSLISSAKQQCYFCYRIHQGLSQEQLNTLKKSPEAGIVCELWWNEKKYDQLFFIVTDGLRKDAGFFERDSRFRYTLTPFEDYKDQSESYEISSTTNAEACWCLISKWLKICEADHEACRRLGDDHTWLPSRLLDVGRFASDVPRLIITKEQQNKDLCPYLALSHCWGKSKIITLTTSNLQTLQQSFPTRELPLNFRDAIHATRKLGFRYLWIDSLCIIQDSIEDWLSECAVMGKVYQNAILCIAATASDDAGGGVFRTRNACHVALYRLDIVSKSHTQTYLAIKSDVWSSGVVETPLNRRGWVVQERLFARRTLHFGRDQIFWECRELYACEAMPGSIPLDLVSDEVCSSFKGWQSNIKKALATTKNSTNQLPAMHPVYRPWELVVETYTCCKLSMPSDKLVALSGVAMEIQAILNDTYLAGLWKKYLIPQLLWYVDRDGDYQGPDPCRVQTYRAPTWSWASIDGPVTFGITKRRACKSLHILDAQVTNASSTNAFGPVDGGHLRIRGQLVEILRLVSETFISSEDRTGCFHPDDQNDVFEECYGLPVAYYWGGLDLCGLVLVPTGVRGDEYRRVGVFSLFTGERLEYLGGDMPEDWDDVSNDDYFNRSTPKSIFTIV